MDCNHASRGLIEDAACIVTLKDKVHELPCLWATSTTLLLDVDIAESETTQENFGVSGGHAHGQELVWKLGRRHTEVSVERSWIRMSCRLKGGLSYAEVI